MNRVKAIGLSAIFASTTLLLVACADKKADDKMSDLNYPATRTVAQNDDYHGTQVADPYRWLEHIDSPEVNEWVAKQNALSVPYLEALPGREAIIARMKTLWNYERFGTPKKIAGRYFFERNDGLQNQDVLYVAESLAGEPKVVLDPNRFSEDATVALSGYTISRDGKLIAYSTSDGGTDWDHWRVMNVETGKTYPEVLGGTKFTSTAWDNSHQGFYYSRYPLDARGKADDQQQVSIYYHKVGTPQSADRHIYSVTDNEKRNPYASVSEDGKFLIISFFEGYEANALSYQRLGKDGPEGEPVALFDQWDARYWIVATLDDTFIVGTDNNAPRGRVIAVKLASPEPAQWQEVVPQAEATMESVSFVGGELFVRYLKDVKSQVQRYDLAGEFLGDVTLPGLGSVSGFYGNTDDTETFYQFVSYTAPAATFSYDIKSGDSTLFKRASVDVDSDAYVAKQVFYNSKDGTLIPMSIIHHKDVVLDGDNPVLLYGYGGFDVSLTPSYSTTRMVWLEMGGIMAIPNLRGGGEYGKSWHLAGTKLEKQNVFDDFIAAAEYLIEKKYTSPKRMAIQGRSNGGLLVGAVMLQRPELFGATLPAVGVMDMLRYHTASANAEAWSSDLGLSSDPAQFAAQYAYSPVHNVSNRCYPATLVTTADRDDRVVPWHSYKFAAALQSAQDCAAPVVLRVETRAGHGAGKPTWMVIEDYADQWAFIAKHLGVKVNLPPAVF